MKNRDAVKKAVIYTFLVFSSIVCLIPFYWMVRSSFMRLDEIFIQPPKILPEKFLISNYKEALTFIPFIKYFFNTITILAFVIIGVVLSSTISAFAFSRIKWPGRNVIFGIILSSMMLPYAVTLIPTFLGWKVLGQINHFTPLIIPAFFGGGAFNVFLLRQFYMSVPLELDEAAFADGAGYFKIYYSIIIPLSRPAIIVIALFTVINTWNDFLGPLIYLNSQSKFTLALGLLQYQGEYSSNWQLLMAASTVVILPTIVVFLFGQKQLIEGISLTGLKG